MVEKKKKSKRITLHKKHKIEHKVRAHFRKLRRLARKNKNFVKRKQEKDPGIPNGWPFKLEMLEAARVEKEKMEEFQAKQKLARQKELDKRRAAVLDTETHDKSKNPKNIEQMAKEAAKREKKFAAQEKENRELSELAGSGLSGIPGVTMQAYYREFRKVVEAADVILEVLDARDPIGCRCPDVEKMIISKYPNKRIVLVLNKIDLVPREVVEGWLKYLRNEYPTIAFKSSRQQQQKLGQSKLPVAHASDDALKSGASLGAETLLQLLKHYAKTGTIQTSIAVGVVGFPNVGKSSVINSLCRTRAAKVGGMPGVTRNVQEVHLDKHVKLLDSPGIVFPKSTDVDNDIILRHCVQIERVPDPISPVDAILRRVRKPILLQVYKIPDFDDVHEFLKHIAKNQGKVGKGGVADFKAAARKVIQDWVGGKIPFYTEAPKVDKAVHVGASIVSGFSAEFDLSQTDELSHLTNKDGFRGQAFEANTTMAESAPLFLYEGEVTSGPKIIPATYDEDMGGEEDNDSLNEEDFDLDEDSEDAMSDSTETTTTSTKSAASSSKSTASTKSTGSGKQKGVVSTKQNLYDEADDLNPQINQAKRKQQKSEKKKKNKTKKVAPTRNDPDVYNFATDFGAADEDDSDIDFNEIED